MDTATQATIERPGVSLDDQIREIKRELKMRHHVYERLVSTGSMRQSEADHRKACMEATLRCLTTLKEECAKPEGCPQWAARMGFAPEQIGLFP